MRSHKTLPFSPTRLAPAGGGARLLDFAAGCGRSSLRLTLSPFLHPQAHAAWRGFSAHPRGCAGEAGNCRASRLWRAPGILSPSRPAAVLGPRARPEAGVCFRALGLKTQPPSPSKLVLDLPRPSCPSSGRRPAAGWAAGGLQPGCLGGRQTRHAPSTAEGARVPGAPGIAAAGAEGERGPPANRRRR